LASVEERRQCSLVGPSLLGRQCFEQQHGGKYDIESALVVESGWSHHLVRIECPGIHVTAREIESDTVLGADQGGLVVRTDTPLQVLHELAPGVWLALAFAVTIEHAEVAGHRRRIGWQAV